MIKIIKKLLGINTISESKIHSITCGERDEHGFCDTYVNGEKTNIRMLVFTEEEIKKLQNNG
jgi:hypothetical protein